MGGDDGGRMATTGAGGGTRTGIPVVEATPAVDGAEEAKGTTAGGRRWETFSFLPPLTASQVATQVGWILARGWVPGVEYTEVPGPTARYWTMWRLPFFGLRDPGRVVAEVEACASTHPRAWVRVVGHDPRRGGLAAAFVVRRPELVP